MWFLHYFVVIVRDDRSDILLAWIIVLYFLLWAIAAKGWILFYLVFHLVDLLLHKPLLNKGNSSLLEKNLKKKRNLWRNKKQTYLLCVYARKTWVQWCQREGEGQEKSKLWFLAQNENYDNFWLPSSCLETFCEHLVFLITIYKTVHTESIYLLCERGSGSTGKPLLQRNVTGSKHPSSSKRQCPGKWSHDWEYFVASQKESLLISLNIIKKYGYQLPHNCHLSNN